MLENMLLTIHVKVLYFHLAALQLVPSITAATAYPTANQHPVM